MSSEPNQGESGDAGTGPGTASRSDAASSTICWVCQQPIETSRVGQARGEPVHAECRAAARCGLSTEDPSDR
ncbi:hypothetical protein ACKVMT_13955 [Halobacteriales archaeon Cl-PHB]